MTLQVLASGLASLFLALLAPLAGGTAPVPAYLGEDGTIYGQAYPAISPEELAAATGVAAPTPSPDLALSLAKLNGAIVNIICYANGHGLRSTSGSGVLFDPRGLILTNAHVAQYLLLQETYGKETVSCTIRTGNPARVAYVATPAYVSGRWVKAHPDTLIATAPKESGRDDFAVLAITGSATPLPLPSVFPAVPLATDGNPSLRQQVAIGSYGAQSLTSSEILSYLYPTLVFGKIQDVFTFERTTVDLIRLGGSKAAQQGSSGGGIASDKGQIIALITTSTNTGPFSSRNLSAVTVGHIRRSFKADTGKNFDAYFASRSPVELAMSYTEEAKALGKMVRVGK